MEVLPTMKVLRPFGTAPRVVAALSVALILAACGEAQVDAPEGVGPETAAEQAALGSGHWNHFGDRARNQRPPIRITTEQLAQALRPPKARPDRSADGWHHAAAEDAGPELVERMDRVSCEQMCGQDMFCRMSCGGDEGPGAAGVPCLNCSRETGFRGVPLLHAERVGHKTVRLTWSEVEGVDHWEIHARRWHPEDDLPGADYEWEADGNTRDLRLQVGFRYAFYVVGFDADGEGATRPSKPARVDLF